MAEESKEGGKKMAGFEKSITDTSVNPKQRERREVKTVNAPKRHRKVGVSTKRAERAANLSAVRRHTADKRCGQRKGKSCKKRRGTGQKTARGPPRRTCTQDEGGREKNDNHPRKNQDKRKLKSRKKKRRER